MHLPAIIACCGLAAWMGLAGPAAADESADARVFVERENAHLATLLKQPASAARDAQVRAAVDAMVDFDELARRALLGASVNEAQRTQVRDLVKRVVEGRYRRGLARALDCELSYKGPRPSAPGEWRVRIELQPRASRRAQPVRIDYVVRAALGTYKIVDVLTEGASLTQNLHDQFEKILATSKDGYDQLVKTLRASADSAALPDAN